MLLSFCYLCTVAARCRPIFTALLPSRSRYSKTFCYRNDLSSCRVIEMLKVKNSKVSMSSHLFFICLCQTRPRPNLPYAFALASFLKSMVDGTGGYGVHAKRRRCSGWNLSSSSLFLLRPLHKRYTTGSPRNLLQQLRSWVQLPLSALLSLYFTGVQMSLRLNNIDF